MIWGNSYNSIYLHENIAICRSWLAAKQEKTCDMPLESKKKTNNLKDVEYV